MKKQFNGFDFVGEKSFIEVFVHNLCEKNHQIMEKNLDAYDKDWDKIEKEINVPAVSAAGTLIFRR
ncbi:MAG: hypothetical protein NT098_02240 [Candidatus Parcubacteria bacterium]|nr:hypothetical protein [Candidatus Parcubacteria bacterium]